MSAIFDALDRADPVLVLAATVMLLFALTALERWLKMRELARGTEVLERALDAYEPPPDRADGTGHEEIGQLHVPIFGAIGWTVLAVSAGWLLGIFQAATWH